MSFLITGFSESDKVPGFVGETQYGAGQINLLSIPIILLLIGLKASGGSITTNTDIVPITSNEDADTYLGAGGECARMSYAAIANGSGFDLRAACPTAAGGAAAAALTITMVSAATSAGTIRIWCDGQNVDTGVQSGDAIATIATNMAAAFAKFPRLSVTASPAAGVVTLTKKCAGIRGNRGAVYFDAQSIAPPATTAVTLGGGGASITCSSLVQGLFFAGGSGVETMTTLLSNLFEGTYQRVAWAENDATTLGVLLAQNQQKAGVLEGRMEHYVVASNDTLVNTTSLAQTTLNDPRFQMCWLLESEIHPSEIAASMAAARAAAEASQPNSSFDGVSFSVLMPQRFPSQRPNRTTQQSALDNSVSPFTTNDQGQVLCVRAITTHSLSGTTPDSRTLDVADAYVPDFVRAALDVFWTTSFVVDNPYVQDDPAEGDAPLPDQVGTPKLWNSAVTNQLKAFEQLKILEIGSTDANPPQSQYDATAKRIMSVVFAKPLAKQHAIGCIVKQLAA